LGFPGVGVVKPLVVAGEWLNVFGVLGLGFFDGGFQGFEFWSYCGCLKDAVAFEV